MGSYASTTSSRGRQATRGPSSDQARLLAAKGEHPVSLEPENGAKQRVLEPPSRCGTPARAELKDASGRAGATKARSPNASGDAQRGQPMPKLRLQPTERRSGTGAPPEGCFAPSSRSLARSPASPESGHRARGPQWPLLVATGTSGSTASGWLADASIV